MREGNDLLARAHALALALDDQPVAVMFDLVKPLRPVRHLGATGWNEGLERWFTHGAKIGKRTADCESPH